MIGGLNIFEMYLVGTEEKTPAARMGAGFALGPNPCRGELRVELRTGGRLEFFDASGRLAASASIPAMSAGLPVSVSGMRDGVYLVRLAGELSGACKLVLRH
jgi:hypothetical protein